MLYKVINGGELKANLGIGGRRIWLDAGAMVTIGTKCTICLMNNNMDGDLVPVLVLYRAEGFQFEWTVNRGEYLLAMPYAPVIVIPRAAQMSGNRAVRMLVDITPSQQQQQNRGA